MYYSSSDTVVLSFGGSKSECNVRKMSLFPNIHKTNLAKIPKF